MANYRGHTFLRETVSLDGSQFYDCVFTNCELVYQQRASKPRRNRNRAPVPPLRQKSDDRRRALH
jgi:hypothetical protein